VAGELVGPGDRAVLERVHHLPFFDEHAIGDRSHRVRIAVDDHVFDLDPVRLEET
jgi:hypothetical protein